MTRAGRRETVPAAGRETVPAAGRETVPAAGRETIRAGERGVVRAAERGMVPTCAALLASALLFLAPDAACASRVEVRQAIDTSALGEIFVYDVDPSGAVLVLTGDNILDAGSGEPLFGEPLKGPAWLSLGGGKLSLLADGVLFAVEGRTPRKLLEVPLRSPIFASDGERTFIGGVTASGRSILYLYKEGAGHKAILELDAPIDAMALARETLFFSAGRKIYALKEGGPARIFATLPGFSYIPSIAVDDRRGILYFSDGDDIYAVRGGDFVLARRGLGGMLRCRNGELYVLSPRARALFRVSGLSDALASAGTLAPLKDPCKTPAMSLYCRAEEKRAVVKSLAQLAGSTEAGGAGPDPLAAYAAGQKKELAQIAAALEKEAAGGVQAVLWGGGREPKTVGARAAVATGTEGMGVTFWDGSEARIGPGSKAVLDDCRPSGGCGQTLENGLMYFAASAPSAEGAGSRRPRGFAISAGALKLGFDAARLAVFASGETVAVVVIEGRVKAASEKDGSVVVAAGEMLEARRGVPLGAPSPADMDRISKWWEEVR